MESPYKPDVYRHGSLGSALIEGVNELVNSRRIDSQMALRILERFNDAVFRIIHEEVKASIHMKGKLDEYRHVDEEWSFVIRNVKMATNEDGGSRMGPPTIFADKITISASNDVKTVQNEEKSRKSRKRRREDRSPTK